MDIYVRSPPIFSFSLTRGCNLFSSNFSSISIALHRRGEFFSGACSAAAFSTPNSPCTAPARQNAACFSSLPLPCCPIPRSTSQFCAILHTLLALAAALLFLYNLFYLSFAALFFVPSSCPLFPKNLQYCLFQQIDSLSGFSCYPWASLPSAPLDFIRFLSGQLDFIGNHQQRHGDLPDLNRWSTVLAVFPSFRPALNHPHSLL